MNPEEIYYSCYKETKDNWFGSFEIKRSPVNLVKITLVGFGVTDHFRIICSGNDDYSLSKEFNPENNNQYNSLLFYLDLLKMETVDQDFLEENGFVFSN